LRERLFRRWTVLSADVLWNRRVWAFPDVFHRTRMTLLAARKKEPGTAAAVPSAGPLADAETFRRARELRIDYSLEDLEAWSPTLELPAIPDPKAGTVFEAMLKHPRFDSETRSWRAFSYRELDATGDSDLYNERGEGWPVWKGRTFDRYRPDLAEPIYWAAPGPVLERLQQKRSRSRGVFGRLAREVLNDPSTLAPQDCRIVFRDVVRGNDTRTMRSCLAPPQVFAIHDAPQLIFERGDERDMLGVLAVLNSLPFDWLVRRRVETHVTFSILNSLPVPEANPHWDRLAELRGSSPWSMSVTPTSPAAPGSSQTRCPPTHGRTRRLRSMRSSPMPTVSMKTSSASSSATSASAPSTPRGATVSLTTTGASCRLRRHDTRSTTLAAKCRDRLCGPFSRPPPPNHPAAKDHGRGRVATIARPGATTELGRSPGRTPRAARPGDAAQTTERKPVGRWIKADRLHPLIAERQAVEVALRGRDSVEREFGRLKNEYPLLLLRVRGIERVRLHTDVILAKLGCALGNARP